VRFGWRAIVGLVLSAALLVWALRDVSLPEVWDVLRSSNAFLFVVAALVATLAFPMRAWRWRYILHTVAPEIPFGPLWRGTAIGMMVNNIAPLRAGEVARAFVLSREDRRVRFTAAFASLVVDRLFDAIVILVLLVAAMAAPSFPRGAPIFDRPASQWALLFGGIALAALAALMVVALFPGRLLSVWDRVAGAVAPRFAARGRHLLEGFASGLGVLRAPRQFATVLAWSVAQWLVNGASFWIAFAAVDIDAPISAALFLQSLLALGVSIPSSPGFFGPFEAFSRAALAVYGVDGALAVSYAIGYHILSFIPITVMGLWYFARLGLHFRDFRGPQAEAA
jgi:uncharacterized protein (TIRG00374 family)